MDKTEANRCPCCGHAMEVGTLHTRYPLIWCPEGTDPPILFRHASPALNQHESGRLDFLMGWKTEAWFCPSCKIVLYRTKN